MQRKVLIAVFGFALLIALLGQSAPKPFQWEPSMNPHDKNPYGLYVLNQRLADLFAADVERLSFSPFERLSHADSSRLNVLSIGFLPDGPSFSTLREHAANGHSVFISSAKLPHTPWAKTVAVYADQALSTLVGQEPKYSSQESVVQYFHERSPESQVLGHIKINNAIYPNFIRVPHGKGWIYLHADPLVFTNYGLLFRDPAFATATLSHLPAHEPLLWYNPLHRKVSDSTLRYVFSEPMLKNAWYMLLAGTLMFFVFNARRNQRVIPVIEPPRNTSIDFARTLGNLYRIEADVHQVLSRKIVYFLERIRHEYHINTTVLDARFEQQLAQKTGADLAITQALTSKINQHLQKRKPAASDDITALNKLIEQLFDERERKNSL